MSSLVYLHDMEADDNGVGIGLGIGYRVKKSRFLLDLGGGVHFSVSDKKIAIRRDTFSATDDYGIIYEDLHIYSDRHLSNLRVNFQLPILFGFEVKSFYMLLGPKLSVGLWGQSKEKGVYSHQGKYPTTIDPFENMPNHNFINGNEYATQPIKIATNFNLNGHIEMGFLLKENKNKRGGKFLSSRYYLALFGEYALLHSTAYTPLEIGVKFTTLLETPFTGPCHCRRK